MFNQSSISLIVSENSLAALIGIPEPRDTGFALSALTARVAVPLSSGTVLLADGVTSLILGQVHHRRGGACGGRAPPAAATAFTPIAVLALPHKSYAVDVLFKAQIAA
jgi:hypothetical protein